MESNQRLQTLLKEITLPKREILQFENAGSRKSNFNLRQEILTLSVGIVNRVA